MNNFNKVPEITAEMSRRIEGIEIEALNELYTVAAQECGSEFLADHKLVGSAWMYKAPSSNVLALNRVIGLGLYEAADNDSIDGLTREIEKSGAPRFFVQLSPYAEPEHLADMLLSRGLTFRNKWVKLLRGNDPIDEVDSPFDVRPIDNEHAEAFGRISTSNFDWPEWMGRAIGAITGKTRWRYYCAFDGNHPIATGGLYMSDDLGYISMAATMPAFRGKGAQQKLAVRRINDAISYGCRMITVETAEDTPEHSAPSFRNMLRMGFRVAYTRPNYIWER